MLWRRDICAPFVSKWVRWSQSSYGGAKGRERVCLEHRGEFILIRQSMGYPPPFTAAQGECRVGGARMPSQYNMSSGTNRTSFRRLLATGRSLGTVSLCLSPLRKWLANLHSSMFNNMAESSTLGHGRAGPLNEADMHSIT